MPNFVNTVFYGPEGQFLLFRKYTIGFFFDSADGGKIYPKGLELNGGGHACLPGGYFGSSKGWSNKKTIADTARVKVEETCGAGIEFSRTKSTEKGAVAEQIEETEVIRFPTERRGDNFAAYYVRLDEKTLKAFAKRATHNFAAAAGAMQAVQAGDYKDDDYMALQTAFPDAPKMNELCRVDLVRYDADLIASFQDESETFQLWQMLSKIRDLPGAENVR